MNITEAIHKGYKFLKKNNIESALLDSEILLSKIIKKSKKFIILNPNKNLKKNSFIEFNNLIRQRSDGKPIAYLTGTKDFWKYEFYITEDVLIPRPDTELIVEEVLKFSKHKTKLSILDIGAGSGCILISILKERKDFRGVGIDLSKKCIDLCKKNALKLNISNKVKFFKSNVDNFSYGKYDLIISNPPYIKKLDLKYLEKDIKNFEPKLALDGGLDGISEIRKVISKSSELVKKNGKLILEIAFDQKKDVKKILKNEGFYINSTIRDLAGNDRCIVSTKV